MPPDSPNLSVCPVTARNLLIERGGRQLLSVTSISLGDGTVGRNDNAGGYTAIVGPNGAGKSLLVRTLCGLLTPDAGQVLWAGQPPDVQRRHAVGLMLQKPVLLRRSAQANLIYALRQTGLDRQSSRRMSLQALDTAGLAPLARVSAHSLSGGEQQRLALARALLLEPRILFLDEATANVDPASTLVIEQQLQRACEHGLKIVLVSHDQGQVRRLADRVILMHQGQLIDHDTCDRFFDQPNTALSKQWVNGDLLL